MMESIIVLILIIGMITYVVYDVVYCENVMHNTTPEGRVRFLNRIDMTKMPQGVKDADAVKWIQEQYTGPYDKGMGSTLAWRILYRWRELEQQGLTASPNTITEVDSTTT